MYVPCLVLKQIYIYTSFSSSRCTYLWWISASFVTPFGLIQCGLWWVSQRSSRWLVTIRDIECSLYGFSSITHARSGWTMVPNGFVWTMAFVGPIMYVFKFVENTRFLYIEKVFYVSDAYVASFSYCIWDYHTLEEMLYTSNI